MSTSETLTKTDLANILNEVLPSTHGIGISKGSWTSSGTSAYNVKVTSDLTLSKGLYLVTIHTPYVASGSGLIGLRINGTADSSCNIVAPTGEYARGAFLVDLSAQSTVAGYSEGSSAVTYSVLDRGGIEAVQLVRYTESPEADYIVEQGTSGIWTYRKWNSGIAECWGIHSWTISAWSGWGNIFESNSSSASYPSSLFVSAPMLSANNLPTSDGGATMGVEINQTGSASATPTMYLIRGTRGNTSVTGYVAITAKGRWK